MRPLPKLGIFWLGLPEPVCRNEPTTRDFTTGEKCV